MRVGIQHDAACAAPRHAGVLGRRPVPRPHRNFDERQVEPPAIGGHRSPDRLVIGMAVVTPGSEDDVARDEVLSSAAPVPSRSFLLRHLAARGARSRHSSCAGVVVLRAFPAAGRRRASLTGHSGEPGWLAVPSVTAMISTLRPDRDKLREQAAGAEHLVVRMRRNNRLPVAPGGTSTAGSTSGRLASRAGALPSCFGVPLPAMARFSADCVTTVPMCRTPR